MCYVLKPKRLTSNESSVIFLNEWFQNPVVKKKEIWINCQKDLSSLIMTKNQVPTAKHSNHTKNAAIAVQLLSMCDTN
jgi:hypothetical protein